MTQLRNFTVADPRTFDGNPFEVGERGVAQLEGMVALMREMLPKAELMARNAEMTRRLDQGEPPEGDRWAETVQGRQWKAAADELERLGKRFRAMKAATAFDPRHPPKV